jgi:hypothetical protein
MNLTNEIKQTPFENYLCLVLFNIPDVYIAHEFPDIILNTLILNNTDHKIKTVIHICKHYIKAKVLSVQHNTLKGRGGGLRMGAPTSPLISEIFLQYTEQTKIINILSYNHILSSSKCFLNFKNLKMTSFRSKHVAAQLDK